MMNQPEIEAYINLLPYNEPFTSLEQPLKDKVVFGSYEMLRRRFGAAVITSEMAALQTLFVAEGEGEEFAKFKRQSVKSMGLDGMSFSFGEGSISPEVLILIEAAQTGGVDSGNIVIFGELR